MFQRSTMIRKLVVSITALLLFSQYLDGCSAYLISVTNGQIWGEWTRMDPCPLQRRAIGFALKVEERQGIWDDTALNGIKLFCDDVSSTKSFPFTHVSSTRDQGIWGTWGVNVNCYSGGYLTSFRLKVQEHQGVRDDTAANDIQFKCSTGEVLSSVNGGEWGIWGPWSGTCYDGICGIQSRIDVYRGAGDDTSLNDVDFMCC